MSFSRRAGIRHFDLLYIGLQVNIAIHPCFPELGMLAFSRNTVFSNQRVFIAPFIKSGCPLQALIIRVAFPPGLL